MFTLPLLLVLFFPKGLAWIFEIDSVLAAE